MSALIARTLRIGGVQRAVRSTARLVDLAGTMVQDRLREIAPRAKGRLLDVGCGDKPFEEAFRPYVTEYVGIEHEKVFHHTSASAAERRPDLYYDGNTLPFPDKSFDTVLSVQVLEHTPHPQRLVSEMARVLKDDGMMILSVPFSFRIHEEPYDFFRYTPYGMRSLCVEAGLEVTEILNEGDIWSVLAHKLNSFLAFRLVGIQNAAQQVGLLKHEPPMSSRGRLWLAPLVLPPMLLASGAAKVLDRIAPDGTEALCFTVFARRAAPSP